MIYLRREPCRYGSSANLVLTTGSGVNGYTLDAALGEFILTHPNVRRATRPIATILTLASSDHDSYAWKDLFVQ